MTDLERIGQRLVTGFPGTALTPELVQVVKEDRKSTRLNSSH